MTELKNELEKKMYDAANANAFELDEGDLNTNRDVFIDGINWYRNNVWHNANEIPDNNMNLLVITEPFDAPCVMTSNSDRFRERVKRWAYIEDLLPTKEDKEEAL